ncbi:MAG: tail fiber domain-containing protein [Deltaproteobacteria bacterium]|nr:MAG: tail fiber domain-containing protein [Deltaproteobacteria bacterium]
MSDYGFRRREDPPERMVPAGSPESRTTSAATMENRQVQALILGENIGEVTAGLLRSEDARFRLELDAALLEVTDSSGNPKVRLGLVDADAGTYGIEIYDDQGNTVLDASGVSVTIGPDTITEFELAENSVTQTVLAPGAVDTINVADEAITAIQLRDGSVTALKILDGEVTELKLAEGSVTTTRLAEGAVETINIDEGAITAPLFAAGAVLAGIINAGRINAAHVQAGSLTAEELNATNLSGLFADLGEITAGILRSADMDFFIDLDNSVATVVDDQAVPVTRVRWGRLGSGPEDYGLEIRNSDGDIVIDATGLGLNVVGTLQIADGAIITDKIGSRQITGEEIALETIRVENLEAGVIDALEINVNELSALSANLGVVTAGIARSADETFVTNYNDAILEVFDEQATPQARVRIGRLGAGATDYGLQVISDQGDLILGADGLGVNVVGSLQIADGAVTGGKVGFQAISTSNIQTEAITTSRLDAEAVTSEKIAVGTIIADNILVGSITGDRLGFQTITADRIGTDAVVARTILANSITAEKVASLNMTVGKDIQSSNYVEGGTQGWRIRGNGDADFRDVTIRGELQLATGTYSGALQSNSIEFRSFGGSLIASIGLGGLSNEPVFSFRDSDYNFVAGFSSASGGFITRTLEAETIKNRVFGLFPGQQPDIDINATHSRINLNSTRWTGSGTNYGGEVIVTAPGPRGFEVNGTAFVTGDVVAFSSSDLRMKDNVATLGDPLGKLAALDGVSYVWNDRAPSWTQNRAGRRDVGLIAQQVREVLPEAVQERGDGMLAVSYERVIPLLVEAVKELSVRVKQLEA